MSNCSRERKSELRKHVHDGFVYKRETISKDGSRIFWCCVRRTGGEKCSGRIHTTADGNRTFLKMVTEHNCSYKGAATSANGPPLKRADGEAKKRAIGDEAQRMPWQEQDGDQNLAFVVGTYAASMRSVDELFELVQGNVGDDPIDFTNLNELQHSIFIKEMARKMEKLRLDFEQMNCSECGRCGKQIEKIATEDLAMVQKGEGMATTWSRGNRDWHRIVQTANRDSECASLAIHTFLYHPTELWPTLRCLYGSESDALSCYPYLDFRKSSSDFFVCFKCRRNYNDLMDYLRHAEMYHKATYENF